MSIHAWKVVVTVFVAIPIAAFAVPAQSYQEVAVANGGTIQGKVVYQGFVPTRKIIPTKDSEVCGGIRDEPEIVVGPDKGVHGAVVYLKKVAKGKAWAKPAASKTPELENRKCRFVPHVQVVRRGSSVVIVNSDPVLHNTHGFYGRRTAFNLALPNQDQRITVELRRPGIVRVECDAHGWMQGWIYVADSPYYAITAEDGTFTITDIPPGNYTLVGWQAHTGAVETSVTVEAEKAVDGSIELKK